VTHLLDTGVWLRAVAEPQSIPPATLRLLEAPDALASNITVLTLTPEIVVEAMRLPAFPNRDPADELIVATARVHQLTLLTTDVQLRRYRFAPIQYFRPRTRRA
jgi:PIN domain nuclease of toxin-antitoxin system